MYGDVALSGSLTRRPEAGDQFGDQRGQEDLAGHRLQHRDGTAATIRGGKVAVAECGERREAEVLKVRRRVTRSSVREEHMVMQVIERRVQPSEHQPDDEVGA